MFDYLLSTFAALQPLEVTLKHARAVPRFLFATKFRFLVLLMLSSGLVSLIFFARANASGPCTPTQSTSGSYTILSFSSVGSCEWTVPDYVDSIELLVIGGGGSGGNTNGGNGAGGGGAGGYLSLSNVSLNEESYTITVGAGGVSNNSSRDNSGENGGSSSFGDHSVLGGGGGAAGRGNARSGASGGGAAGRRADWLSATGGAATSVSPELGNAGGNNNAPHTVGTYGSDGGGAGGGGSAGAGITKTAVQAAGTNGGPGTSNSITGSAVTYASGGSGGYGACYGAGCPTSSNGAAGTNGTGNGGQGASSTSGSDSNVLVGGSGGSGIVIIRFVSQCNPTIATNAGSNYRFTFTNAGICNWVSPSDVTSYKYLIVGGGGGGGRDGAGGGGGGQVASSTITLSANTIYSITVGNGGANSTNIGVTAASGGISKFASAGSDLVVVRGGGGGGSKNAAGVSASGSAVISSGGGGGHGGSFAGGSGNSTYGFAGGTGFTNAGGGGGGAASAGANASSGQGGAGGGGISNSFSGTSVTYGSGGGGGSWSGSGGLGGSGAGNGGGSSSAATSPTANTGGGGGGAGADYAAATAGAAGIFILINDFDTPAISWDSPSANGYVTSLNFTPDWTLSDASSGISSSSGTAVRQKALISSGNCGASWIDDAIQTKGNSLTLDANYCYRWTFDSSITSSAVAPTDNVGTPLSSDLTSPQIRYDTAPYITSIYPEFSNRIYTENDTLRVNIIFNESVTLTGDLNLDLETSLIGSDLSATCTQLLTNFLRCTATIRASDSSADLDYVSSNALSLTAGASLIDATSGVAADLTLPTPGQSGSLSFNRVNIVAGTLSNKAVGGDISYVNGYILHKFSRDGTFAPTNDGNFEILVIGGGGGGGHTSGGGGGGGGIAYSNAVSLTGGSTYSVSVGSYGTAANSFSNQATGGDGGSSSISLGGVSLVSATGGRGGVSSGGAGGAAGTASASGWTLASGGAGGAGNASGSGANGNDGYSSDITGTTIYFAGGGGGAPGGSGGLGEGGRAGTSGNNGVSAIANYGSGGGGGANSGGFGGTGVVYIRYLIDQLAPEITWNTPNADGVVTSSGYTPVWSIADVGVSGLSSAGVVTRQFQTYSSGSCSGSWTNDGTYVSSTSQNLVADRCYRWTFTSPPTDTSGNATSTNLSSSTIIYNPVPIISSVTSTNVDGVYTSGQTISISITFSENVSVTGTPQLYLETGNTDQVADCSQFASPSNVMTCTFTVAQTSDTNDLAYVSTSSLDLNNAVITDGVNEANLTLPEVGSVSSLSGSKQILLKGESQIGASGGEITINGNYVYHTIKNNDTFSIHYANKTIQALIVGAGGGGGYDAGGGGGGGGIAFKSDFAVSTNDVFSIIIGNGGSGGTSGSKTGATGGSTSLEKDSITIASANGGNGGGGCNWNGTSCQGANRGGAGGSATAAGWTTYSGASGGNGFYYAAGPSAAIAGSDGTNVFSTYYSGGGGGGYSALGGLGGGANGNTVAVANTGGGGGGGAGNAEGKSGGSGVVVFRYLIDAISEAPVITSNQAGTTTSASTIFSFTGEVGATFECKVDSENYSSCTSPHTVSNLTTGSHIFYVKQTDSSGNVSSAATLVWSVDAISPSIQDFSALTNTYTNSSSLEFEITFSESISGLSSGDFSVVGWSVAVSSGSGAGAYLITLTQTTATDGAVTLVINDGSVQDAVGNTLNSSLASRTAEQIFLDTTAPNSPTITLDTLTCSDLRNTSATATFSSLDALSGVAGYRFTVDGSTPDATSASSSSTQITNQGITILKVSALDNAGNLSGPTTCSIDIDSVAPIATWSSQPISPTSLSSVDYGLSFDQTITGLTSADFSISGTATGCQVNVAGSADSYTVTVANCSQGTFQLILVADSVTDDRGNDGPTLNFAAASVVRSVIQATTQNTSVTGTFDTVLTSVSPVSASGGIASLSYSISPSLPSGLSLNTTSGEISGTPTTSSTTQTYTISASDGYVTSTSDFDLEILQKSLIVQASDISVDYLQSFTPSTVVTGLAISDSISATTYLFSGQDNSGNSYSSSTAPTAAGTYTLEPTAITFSTGNSSNYDITFSAGNLTINKISQNALSLTALTSNVYYQESTILTLSGGSGTGGEVLSLGSGNPCTLSGNTLSTTGVGTCTISATKAADSNYLATSTTLTLTAAPFPVVVTVDDEAVDYGDSFSPTYITSGLKNSDAIGQVAFLYSGISPTIYSSSATKPTATGSYSISASVSTLNTGDLSNYSFTYNSGTLEIRVGTNLVITADDKTIIYGSSFNESFTDNGLIGTDVVGSVTYTYQGTGGTNYGPTAIKPVSVGTYSITPSSAIFSSGNASAYSLNYVSGTLTILARSVTVTADGISLTYGSSQTASFTSTSLSGSDVISSIVYTYQGTGGTSYGPSTTQPLNVGTYSITPSNPLLSVGNASNYSFNFVPGVLSISPKTLTLRASSPSISFGSSYSPYISDVNSDLVGSDAIASASFSYAPNANPSSVGTYTITPSAAVFSAGSAGNYSILYQTGTLTISKARQSALNISASSVNIEVGQTSTLSTSGGSSSGSVSFIATGGCSVSGSTITALSASDCLVTATKAGDNDYLAENSSTLTISIDPIPAVTISTLQGPYSNSDTLTYAITFNLTVSGLSANDFTASGWVKTLTGSGKNYSLLLSSPNNSVSDGVISVSVSFNRFSDTNTDITRDTIAPTSVAQFTSTPNAIGTSSSETFIFSGAANDEVYQCKINSNTYSTCSSTHLSTGLSSGIQTMYVRTADLAGNFGSETSFTWTIELPVLRDENRQSVQVDPTRSSDSSKKEKTIKVNPRVTIKPTVPAPERNLNPPNQDRSFSIVPNILKPWVEKLPFFEPEDLVSKELLPDKNSTNDFLEPEKLDGVSQPSSTLIVDENNVEQGSGKFLIPSAIKIQSSDGSYTTVRSSLPVGSNIDLNTQRIIAQVGNTVEIKATGLKARSEYVVWLRSEPIYIGRGLTDAKGAISAMFIIPSGSPLGTHTIEINAFTKTNQVKTVSVPTFIITPVNSEEIQKVAETPVEKEVITVQYLLAAVILVLLASLWTLVWLVKEKRSLVIRSKELAKN